MYRRILVLEVIDVVDIGERITTGGITPSAVRIYFALSVMTIASLVIITMLWLTPPLGAMQYPAVKNPVAIMAAVPEKQRLRLISSEPVTANREVIGIMVLYDDAATKRPVDYAELCSSEGDLLAVHWFDRFGIERTAIDSGIILQAGGVEGTLVLLLDGDFI